MSMRRIDLGSGKNTTENQDEIRNCRTHVKRKRFHLLICVLCIGIILTAPQLASSQDRSQCLPHCWNKTSQDISFTDGVHLETISEERDCKDVCFNNETCTGVYWGFDATLMNTSCWLQMPFSGTTASLKNANYWDLTTCSDDCVTYCWLPKWVNVQSTDGSVQKDISGEGQCKSLCSKDQTCNGVDWDGKEPSCSLLFASEIKRNSIMDPIRHWEIIRNLQANCLLEAKDLHEEGLLPTTVAVEPVFGENETVVPTEIPSFSSGNETVSNETKEQPKPSGGGKSTGNKTTSLIVHGHEQRSHVNLNQPGRCPSYLAGIITMTAMMAVCIVIISSLIAYIIYLRLRLNKLERKLVSLDPGYRDYQSIQQTPDASEDEYTDLEY